MKKQGRYSTSGLVEDQYMPGSKGRVLRNLLDITSLQDIERVETELLFELTDRLLDEIDSNHCFSADDIMRMHRRWLNSNILLRYSTEWIAIMNPWKRCSLM